MWPFNSKVKKSSVTENYDVIGTPYTQQQWQAMLAPYKQVVPYARDPWAWKAATVRTIQELDQVRQVGRWLSETNPWAHGLLVGLRAFVIGKGFEIHVNGKDAERKSLVKKIETLLGDWAEENELDEWYQEAFYRDHRDGETFFQLGVNDEGILELWAVEPDQIRIPHGESTEGQWSMGIKHKKFNYQRPEAYCVEYFDATQQIFPANKIFHSKLNVVRNTKRGISSFYPVYEVLNSTQKLLWCWQEGDKARASMAYAIQSNADKAAIQALTQNSVTGTRTVFGFDNNEYEYNVEQTVPGRVLRIPQGWAFVPPPAGSEESEAIRFGLQAVAARFNAPNWLVSGESGDSSYASAVLPESLFLRRCEHEQARQMRKWKKILTGVIEAEIQRGQVPENVLDLVEIELEPPSPISRNREEEIKSDLELLQKKIMSRHTFDAKYGLDFDKEQDLIEQEPELAPGPDELGNLPGAPETMSGQMQRDIKRPQPEG